ncbi:MAG TPA: AarF/UbiB family protein [Polyangia bacterium]
MPAAREKTEELRLEDLAPAPPAPGTPPPLPGGASAAPVEAVATPAPDVIIDPAATRSGATSTRARRSLRRTEALRRPWRRLARAYTTTFLILASYLWLAVRRRFVDPERLEVLIEETHRRNARRVEQAVVELQGLFIKVGQLISIMANFLPGAFRQELEGLQDQVPPRPYEDIEARLLEEWGGRRPEQIFAAFDRTPIASASIGQVHRARLHDGREVAVKVQYPDIEAIVRVDLQAMHRIFAVLGRFMPEWGFSTIYREIREMILTELDYRKEAEAMSRIAAKFAGRADVCFPDVIADVSTARVLTTRFMSGVKAADLEGLRQAGIDTKKAARLVVDAYCQQIFVDGHYHADPHPGNLLLRKGEGGEEGAGPTLIFLDFGATGEVSPGMRKGMVSFIQGAMTKDTARIVAAMKEMGFISRKADPEVFDRVVEYFHDRFRSQLRVDGFSLKDIRFEQAAKLESFLDLRALNVSLADLSDSFHVPKEWVLLERTLLLLLGVCTTLDPEMNPIDAIGPYVERFVLGEKKEVKEAFLEAAREAAFSTLALPAELGRFLGLANRNNLGVQVLGFDDGARALYAVFQQLLWAGLAAFSTGLAVVFDGRAQAAGRNWAIGCAIFFGLLLFGALLRGRRHARARRPGYHP